MTGGVIAGIIGMVLLVLTIITLLVLAFIFWIWMLVDSIKRKYKDEDMRVVWVLVIIFLHVLGAIIYYFVEKRKDKKGK